MTSCLYDTIPADIGLPDQFTAFRDVQRQMVDFAVYGPGGIDSPVVVPTRRFAACGAPTGSGKSLGAHAIGIMSGERYAVLTATLGLEEQQVKKDKFTLVNIRGRSNYDCLDSPYDENGEHVRTCEDADEHGCYWQGKAGCSYYDQVERAKQSRAILTNYQYWLHARSRNRGALEGTNGKIGLLICDEFHLAMRELARFLGVWFSNQDLHHFADQETRAVLRSAKGNDWGKVGAEWLHALETMQIRVGKRMGDIAGDYKTQAIAYRESKEYRRLDKVAGNLDRITSLGGDNNWIWQLTKSGVSFNCVWPARYAERYLWSGVPRIVLMSATLRPKAYHLCGVSNSDIWFREWPRIFPAHLSPVYWLPTGRMGKKADNSELDKAVRRADEIYDVWAPKHKGIVHTASYYRAEWLQANSKWGRHMLLNKRGESATEMAERFRKSEPPCLLVSPSYTAGYDFADSACEFQHIIKLPFPDRSDPVMVARIDSDPDYYDYETMQTLVQACGRGTRHEKDRCTTIITDDSVGNFRKYAAKHAPRWFRVTKIDNVPVPKA